MTPLLRVLLGKEIIDAARDRRALMGAFMYALFGPLVMAAALNFAITANEDDKTIYIHIDGAAYAPVLVAKLAEQKIISFDSDDDITAQKRWREKPISLLIPDDYQKNISAGNTVDLVLQVNSADKNRHAAINRVKASIQNYGNELATYRMVLRGVDPHLLNTFTLLQQDQASAQEKSGFVMGALAVFVLMSVFVASTSIAIDTSAGERERNSLELILTQPISTLQLIAAKVCAVTMVGMLGAALTLLVTSVVMGFVPLAKLGIAFELDLITIVIILITLLPLAIFAACFQLFCAFQARSFKEAQSYISLTIMIPLTIPFAVQFMPHKPDWIGWVPVASQSQLLEDIAKGQGIDWLAAAIGSLLTLLIAALLAAWMTRALKSEKVILALG